MIYVIRFKYQELEDIKSALSYFVKNYPKKDSVETRKDMKNLLKKLWKIK